MPNRPEKPHLTPLETTMKATVKKGPTFDVLKITALTTLLRKFKPILVNESDPEVYTFEARDAADDPTKDEIIAAMGEAIQSFSEMLKQHENLKRMYSEIYSDSALVHTKLGTMGVVCKSLEEGFETVVDRHMQALSVIKTVATIGAGTSEETMKQVTPAVRFCEVMERRMEKAIKPKVTVEMHQNGDATLPESPESTGEA